MRTLARSNSILGYIGRRIRVTMSRPMPRGWRKAVMAAVCTLGVGILTAGAGVAMWALLACATLERMANTIPLTSIH